MDIKELMSADPTQQSTPEPTEMLPIATNEPERSVYDGEVSDTILAKLSAYYNEHADQEEYVIYRADQYNYYLIYGDYNNGQFTNATSVLYHTQSYYNTVDCTISVSTGVSARPDLTGDTGYIYSSIDTFLPSRYINSQEKQVKKGSMVITVCVVLGLLVAIIGIWFKHIRGRWLR